MNICSKLNNDDFTLSLCCIFTRVCILVYSTNQSREGLVSLYHHWLLWHFFPSLLSIPENENYDYNLILHFMVISSTKELVPKIWVTYFICYIFIYIHEARLCKRPKLKPDKKTKKRRLHNRARTLGEAKY